MTYTDEQLRRIDALVAEHVMGWTFLRETVNAALANGSSCDSLIYRTEGLSVKTYLPHYTTDHNARGRDAREAARDGQAHCVWNCYCSRGRGCI